MSDNRKHLIRSAELDPEEFSHTLNPNSAMRARFLSRAASMLSSPPDISPMPRTANFRLLPSVPPAVDDRSVAAGH